MNIWIDLSNSPHVLFFKPIICELVSKGNKLFVTHRDFAQTKNLCEIFDLNSEEIGNHGGQGTVHKIRNILKRAHLLRKFAYGKKIDIAISHNSYSHCIAAKSLGLRYLTIMDYEYQPANHINFRLANEVLVPFTFELRDVRRYGATSRKMVKYPGLKEEVYLSQFSYCKDFWKRNLSIVNTENIVCAVRPPATMAAYHNFENPLFYKLIKYLGKQKNTTIVLFPRTKEQKSKLEKKFPDFIYPDKAVDGAQLIANSDLVISAGGTMNREAAVLGTPAYTVYAGKMGSVDKYLIKEGKIKHVDKTSDFPKIKLSKKNNKVKNVSRNVFEFIVDRITRN